MALYRPSDALSDLPAAIRRREHTRSGIQTERVRIGIPISGNPRPFARRTNAPFGSVLIPAIVTTAITAASGTTPGIGNAQLYYLDTDATTATADPDNTNVDVYNWLQNSGTVAIGKHIFVSSWSNVYWLAVGDC